MFQEAWKHPVAPWGALAAALAGALSVAAWVDLSPRVEGEFFFSEDDPQLAASREVARRYATRPQIIVRVDLGTSDRADRRELLRPLVSGLEVIDGIEQVYSEISNDPASPLFGRILGTPDPTATNVVVRTDGTDPEVLLPRIERFLADLETGPLQLAVSGVPVIVELIRRSLFRDLIVFSAASFLVFGALMLLIYRSLRVLLATLAACVLSVSVTLLLTRAAGVYIGLLTANLVTIVFVLTLSHVVFLTVNWRAAPGSGPDRAVTAVRWTLEGSVWSMATTLLGFLSLLTASARPLRELGVAGALGTATAMAVAYAVVPSFLARAPAPVAGSPARPRPFPRPRRPGPVLAVLGALTVVAGLGVGRLDTDPGLLTYFAPGTELRDDLERIDRDGGSSTLDVLVRDPEGSRLDTEPVYRKMRELQSALESDPDVGVVLSPAVLLEHARAQPLARFLSLETLLDIASSPRLDNAASAYVGPDRLEGRFSLRMREAGRTAPRDSVIARVERAVAAAGLEATESAGLYELQSQLGHLIRSSLRLGLGGLFVLFAVIALAAARDVRVGTSMLVSLAAIPFVVLGAFAWAAVGVDIVTTPAANVAMAMGVDAMLHLVVRERRLRREGLGQTRSWRTARDALAPAILSATVVICAGFGIFTLSSFPPTRRFGIAVVLGTATAAVAALVVLPEWRLLASGEVTPESGE